MDEQPCEHRRLSDPWVYVVVDRVDTYRTCLDCQRPVLIQVGKER